MGNGERVRAGLTVGKNVKLEKNHVPRCQADHWVWNVGEDAGILGGTVPWAWGPVLPLPPWAGHRWTWEKFRGGKLEDRGLPQGPMPTFVPTPQSRFPLRRKDRLPT